MKSVEMEFSKNWNLKFHRFFEDILLKVIGWYKNNFFFIKAALFTSGLVTSNAFVEYAVVGVFISYLTQKGDHTLPIAAKITNIQDGLSTVLKIVVAFVSDAYTGRFKMVVYSTVIYILGLATLCIAAWIPNNYMALLWVALLLVSIGKAGRRAPLQAFMADQVLPNEIISEEAEKHKTSRQSVWWNIFWFLGSIIALFTSASWKILCLISAIGMFAAWLCFLSGFAFYSCIKPTGSPLTNVFYVVKMAISKRQLRYPVFPSQFYKNHSDQIKISPAIPFFRWLDKAAIVEIVPICPQEQQEKEGKLCTVTEVEEVKLLLTMIPMWTTFLVYSVVDSLGSTFFLEQAKSMDGHIGIIENIPEVFFLMMKSFTGFMLSYFYRRNNRHVRVMIGLGMMWSTLSCCAATIVEHWKKDDSSAFLLTPQFIFLGLMEGYATNGLEEFFDAHVSESMRNYGPHFTDCVLGVGKFMSIILISICKDWIGDDVESSHLDRYFGTIALLNVLNLIAFGFIASQYGDHDTSQMTYSKVEPQVIVDHSFGTNSSPEKSETQLGHGSGLVTITGSGTELNIHIINKEDERSYQLRTRYPGGRFRHSAKSFYRSFTAIGCETNQSQIRRIKSCGG